MTVAKNIEVVASSTTGVEDAVTSGVAKVGETVKNIQGAWVKDIKAVVTANAVTEWRVTLAITFLVD